MSTKTKAQLLTEGKALQKRLAKLQAEEAKSYQKNDISNKKTLQEGEERWQTLFASSPDYIVMLDGDLRIVFSNRTLPGLTIDELIGKHIHDFVVEEKRSEIKGILEKVLKTGEPAIYETQYFPPYGSTIYYETRAVRRTIDGNVIGLALNTRDIIERKQKEEKLNRESLLMDILMNNSPDSIYFKDLQSRYIRISIL